MSLAQIEQFSNRVHNDPGMFGKLIAGTQTPDEFIDKAVLLGKETGFDFSREEADRWVQSQIEAKANGELSDLQLEGVAGGKGGGGSSRSAGGGDVIDAFISDPGGTLAIAGEGYKKLGNDIAGAATAVYDWFSSW